MIRYILKIITRAIASKMIPIVERSRTTLYPHLIMYLSVHMYTSIKRELSRRSYSPYFLPETEIYAVILVRYKDIV